MNQTKSLVSKLFALSALALSLAFVPISHAILTSPIEETTYAWTGTQTPSVTDSYYSQASGLTGSALKSKLYTFNKPVSTSYDWGRYEAADEAYDNSNYVICLYTRHDIPKSAHVGGSYSWDLWNREHIYTQSAFPNSDTDNHNIFACEGQINNDRGNLKFGEVTHNSSNQLTVHGHLTDNYRANSLFEPCDEAKGEVARAVLYTSLYYNYTISSIFSSEAVCLKWHAQFPVTEREIFRNNKVYVNQGNRNPFVDHPSYANSIYNPSTPYTEADPLGGGTPVTAPNTITVTPSSSSIAVGGNVTLTANVDSGSSSVAWSSSNNNVATVSNGVVTGVAAGTATITATSTLDSSVKGTATITVKSLSTLSLSGTATNKSYSAGQSFNPAGLTITATYSDSSTANVTSSVVWTPDPLTEGTTFVTGSYGGKTVSVSGLTVTAPVGYSLVTSASQLSAGDSLIFAYNSTSSTAGALTSSYLSSVSDATFSADKNTITNPGSSMLFTLGGTSGSWTFSNSDGDYLSSSSKNLSFVDTTTSNNAKWTISVVDNNSTVGNVKTTAEKLQYNTTSPRFKTYDSSQGAIQLYRQGGSQSSVAVTGVSLSPSSLNLIVGDNSNLTATISPVNATNQNVSWASSNSNVASVSNGTVTANAAGSATITVTTSDGSFTDSCSVIVVAPATLSSLTFTGTPTTTAYYAGQSFNPSGLTITAHFSDGSTSNVTLQCSFSPNPLTLGATSVIASYTFGGITKTATISGITVVNRVVSSISVLNNPTKMSYTIGQSFDPTGMIIRATYNMGPTDDDYSAYTYAPTAAFDSLGAKIITITSTDNPSATATLEINVAETVEIEGTYGITSGATTYTKPMDPTMLVINKSNSESPDITFSDISDNVRLFGSPITGSIMIGNGSTSGGSFKMTLDSGLYVSKIEFVGNDKDTGAAGTATLSVNNASVNFSDITAEDSVILKPYSNSITITTTARIWTHEIKITALSAQSCALEFGQYFLDTTAAQCASKNVTSATWNTIQSFYNGLNVDIQNAIKASASNQNGNAMEHAMARYDDIISKYGLTDFLGTGNPSKGLNGMSNSSNYMLVFISVIGMFTAIGCTLYLVKKKKEKLS